MAQQQTTTAAGSGTDSAGQAPLRVFTPAWSSPAFWAAHAVNDDTMCEVYEKFLQAGIREQDPLTRLSMFSAKSALQGEARLSFRLAKENGALLFAWYGSSALEDGAA